MGWAPSSHYWARNGYHQDIPVINDEEGRHTVALGQRRGDTPMIIQDTDKRDLAERIETHHDRGLNWVDAADRARAELGFVPKGTPGANSGNNYYYKRVAKDALAEVERLKLIMRQLQAEIDATESHGFNFVSISALRWILRRVDHD